MFSLQGRRALVTGASGGIGGAIASALHTGLSGIFNVVGPGAVPLKVAIRESQRPADRRDVERVAAMVEACFRSDDYREGQAAFLEKRPPRFQGR